MELILTLWDYSKRKHWIEGLQWLLWISIGGLLPVWATYFHLKTYGQQIQFLALTENGEFLLYSASFIASSFFILIRDVKLKSFPSKVTLSLLLLGMLLVSCIIFSQISTGQILSTMGIDEPLKMIDKSWVKFVSSIMLPLTIFLSYMIIVAENVRRTTDVRAFNKRKMDELEDDFDQLEEN